MATSAADVSNSSLETISDEERRWMVVGICLTKVLTPALRVLLADKMPEWYESLRQSPYEIDKQISTKHLKKPPHSKFNFNYKSINNNSSKDKACYDYAVKDPISLAMLFLQPHMAKCNGFDESMDTSAVLTIVAQAQPFVEVSGIAKTIRDVRNEWAHCNFSHWTDANYQAALEIMKDLIGKIDLVEAVKTKILGDLDDWRQKGVKLCFNQQVDNELVSLFKNEFADLHKTLKSWRENVEDNQKKLEYTQKSMEKDFKEELENLKEKLDQLNIIEKNKEDSNSTHDPDNGISTVNTSTVDGIVQNQDETDDLRQICTARDPPLDTTKLSNREVTILSMKVVTNWRCIAGLANLENGEVENVSRDHINYPGPKDKAARILVLISNRPNFKREKFGNILKEAGFGSLVDDLQKGTFYHEP